MSSHSSGRPPTQRLFAAVLPPGTAVAALRTAVAPLHALPGAGEPRWTCPEGWHFTLAFYGEVEHRRHTPHLTPARSRGGVDLRPFAAAPAGFGGERREAGELRLVRSVPPVPGCRGSGPATRRCGPGHSAGERCRYARRVDPKTRNRVMAAVLVLMFVVVAVGSALGG